MGGERGQPWREEGTLGVRSLGKRRGAGAMVVAEGLCGKRNEELLWLARGCVAQGDRESWRWNETDKARRGESEQGVSVNPLPASKPHSGLSLFIPICTCCSLPSAS